MKYFLLILLILLICTLGFLGYWLFKRNKHKLFDFINMPEYTIEEIEKHNTHESLWVHYEGYVYDITKYISQHPGGTNVFDDIGGKNLKTLWENSNVGWHITNYSVINVLDKYKIGIVKIM
jgi:cytochrome b involved in lipid metabolism